MTRQTNTPREKPDTKSKREQDRELSEALEATFPASDPPASTQPGSGTTEQEKAK